MIQASNFRFSRCAKNHILEEIEELRSCGCTLKRFPISLKTVSILYSILKIWDTARFWKIWFFFLVRFLTNFFVLFGFRWQYRTCIHTLWRCMQTSLALYTLICHLMLLSKFVPSNLKVLRRKLHACTLVIRNAVLLNITVLSCYSSKNASKMYPVGEDNLPPNIVRMN